MSSKEDNGTEAHSLNELEELRQHLVFERLIATISTRFIQVAPEWIDARIDRALEEIGEFADVDRAFLFVMDEHKNIVTKYHEWCAPGVTSYADDFVGASYEQFPWAYPRLVRGEVLHIPDVAALDEEAASLRGLLEGQEVKSTIIAPLVREDRLLGFFGFDSVRRHRTWPPEAIALLEILAQVFGNAMLRQQTAEELNHHQRFERLVATFSTRFVGVHPARLDDEINNALQTIGEFAQVDRCYASFLAEDGQTLSEHYEWCASGISSGVKNVANAPIDQFPWGLEILMRGETLHVPRVADLPPEAAPERTLFESQSVLSSVNVPLFSGESPLGYLGFDMVSEEREWPERIIASLRVLGQVFANAFKRARTEKELRHHQEFERIIASLSTRFISVEPEDLDNEVSRALRIIGEFADVDRCYIALLLDYSFAVFPQDLVAN